MRVILPAPVARDDPLVLPRGSVGTAAFVVLTIVVLAPAQCNHPYRRDVAEHRVFLPIELASQAPARLPLGADGDPLLQETHAAREEPQKGLVSRLARGRTLVGLGRDGEHVAMPCERNVQCVAKVKGGAHRKAQGGWSLHGTETR